MEERLLLKQLRDILLAEDREELQHLKKVLDNPVLLSQKVTPIIEERLSFLKNNFPVEFRLAVEEIVEQKIETSKDELLEVIYPALGAMIKKYIQLQFQLLKESLEQQIRDTFEKGIVGRVRYAVFGVKAKDMSETVISRLDQANIEEIFVIEHHSGILLGSASREEELIDLDMIAGMLTAIKAFVEDAFRRGQEQLEGIQYGTFAILLENYHTYYIAAAISGSISATERVQLSDNLAKFAQTELRINLKKKDGSSNFEINQRLKKHFFHPPSATLQQGRKSKAK